MRAMHCRCGQPVFFDNHSCAACGRLLAFDPVRLEMQAEETPGSGLPFCSNREGPSNCNWLADPEGGGLCLSCRLSRVIPALSKRANRERWRKLETAKRRLIYDLLQNGLPVDPARLGFVFKEDRRTNPYVHDDHVGTGHASGVITINAAEADDVFRAQMRIEMNERVRTLLGHFRHESGHYYFDEVVDAGNRDEARALFGDESADYAEALDRHYRDGPPPDWYARYVSAYASAHPAEDWAECWAHYLHIRAVLDVAAYYGLVTDLNSQNWYPKFVELVLALNEIVRSLGQADVYPFVLTQPVVDKIEFVHRAIARRREHAAA